MAKRQGPLDWFLSLYHNDERFLLIMGTARLKLVTASTLKFIVEEYRECLETTTEVIVDDQGEMMTNEELIDYACSRRVNRSTAPQAEAAQSG